MIKKGLIFIFIFFFAANVVFAEPAPAPESVPGPKEMTLEKIEATFNYKQGKIELPGNKATLDVPSIFRYLGPDDASIVLEKLWGNPPGEKTLGMLFPSNVSPLSEEGWGVILSYYDEGHVSDDEADSIDYGEMLKNMQKEALESNPEREKRGYSPIAIEGWAEPPYYDKTTRKLYWAKELKFGDSLQNTLNYDIRVLGRDGVLVVSAVASMEQLPEIRESMKEVLKIANFNEGDRYTDFNPSTDKVAAYGLAALVGGAVAAKSGLIAKLIGLLIVGKKFIIIALVGIGAWISSLLKRKKRPGQAPEE